MRKLANYVGNLKGNQGIKLAQFRTKELERQTRMILSQEIRASHKGGT